MNLVERFCRRGPVMVCSGCAAGIIAVLLWLSVSGCSDNVRMATEQQVAAFEKVDIPSPSIDMTRVQKVELHTGPYRVVPGDVLEFTMPALLQAVTATAIQAAQTRPMDDLPYVARVSDAGTIALPAVGEIGVVGRSLAEIEELVIAAYHQHTVLRPSVYVRVAEYKTANIHVTGAVAKPGVYALRTDQMTLAHLLAEAGGIREEGATLIRVIPAGQDVNRLVEASNVIENRWVSTQTPSVIEDTGGGGVSIRFTPDGCGATAGRIVLTRSGEVLLDQRLDIQRGLSRQVLLAKLYLRDPQLSIAHIETRLTAMAERVDFLASEQTNPPLKRIRLASDELGANPASGRSREMGQAPTGVVPTAVGSRAPEWEGATTLPVYALNIPFTNVALREGDTVIVEKFHPRLFSVLGLVKDPGNFEYPPDVEYNLAQAIAFAGGLDAVAAPHYVTVYRILADGSVGRVPFKLLDDNAFTQAWHVPIRPGDVVAVENTPRTRMNSIVHNLLRINTGVYITGRDLWDNN